MNCYQEVGLGNGFLKDVGFELDFKVHVEIQCSRNKE